LSTPFNRLTDVLDIKLTSLGKKRFASGTFNPVYYAFADNNIIYDSNYFGYTGSMSSSIWTASEQNKTVDIIDGQIRPRIFGFPSTVIDNNKIFKPEFLAPSILGSSEAGNQKYPAFELKLYNGHLSGSPQYVTGVFLNQRIPQLTLEMNCIYSPSSQSFQSQEYLLMEVNELNGLFEKENFEYKIYRRRSNISLPGIPATLNFEQQLDFKNNQEQNESFNGNIEQLFEINEQNETKNTNVEYWFEISTDENILDIIDFEKNEFENIYLKPENNKQPDDC
jgi:hypothetical protein